jgi:uncharacterized coiled-coil DUF342 family protein
VEEELRELLERIDQYVQQGEALSKEIAELPMEYYNIANNQIGEYITHEQALDKLDELNERRYIPMLVRTKDSKKFV